MSYIYPIKHNAQVVVKARASCWIGCFQIRRISKRHDLIFACIERDPVVATYCTAHRYSAPNARAFRHQVLDFHNRIAFCSSFIQIPRSSPVELVSLMAAAVGYRTGQNVCSAGCPIDHIDPALDKIQEPSNSWPDIRGLHSLNHMRDAWLVGDAIEVSIKMYVSGLPSALQDKIWVGIPGVDAQVWHMGAEGRDALLRAIKTPARRAFRMFKMTEYSILPICTNGNHWVLAIVHKNQRPAATGGENKEWSHVAQVAVLDPFRSSARTRMVQARLREWLEKAGKFTFAADYEKTVWIPLQKDHTSCGPRAYWASKQILDRLLVFHENHLDYEPRLWAGLSGWFNEDFVRAEMMGRCAWAGVRAMDYKARIAIECVNEVKDLRLRNAPLTDAGAAMKPLEDRSAVPEERPQPQPHHVQPAAQPALNKPAASSNKPATVPQTPVMPLAPIPNQHQIAPGVRPAKPDMATGSDNGKGPAWAPNPKSSDPRSRGAPGPKAPSLKSVNPPSSSRANTTLAPKPIGTGSTPSSRPNTALASKPINTSFAPSPRPNTQLPPKLINTSLTPSSRANTKPAPKPMNTNPAPSPRANTKPAPKPINPSSTPSSRANTQPAPKPTNTNPAPSPRANPKPTLGSQEIAAKPRPAKPRPSPPSVVGHLERILGPEQAAVRFNAMWGPGPGKSKRPLKRSNSGSDDAPVPKKRRKEESP